MNYCIYNKELDQYLSILLFYNDSDLPDQTMIWSDEFKRRIPDPDKIKTFFNPSDPDDKKSLVESEWNTNDLSIFIWVHRCINQRDNSEIHIKDIIIVPINESLDLPEFAEAVTMIDLYETEL